MHRKRLSGWLRYFDFIAIDSAALQAAYLLSVVLYCFIMQRTFWDTYYGLFNIELLLCDLFVAIAFNTMNDADIRGYYVELKCTFRHCFYLFALVLFVLFTQQLIGIISRLTTYLTAILYIVISYLFRCLWKFSVRKAQNSNHMTNGKQIIIVTDWKSAKEILKRMTRYSSDYTVNGLVISDRNATGVIIDGIPVVAEVQTAADYICRNWIDNVFFFKVENNEAVQNLINLCREMALTIHVYVAIQDVEESRQIIERMAGYNVLTTSINFMETQDAVLKRCMDIFGGLIGCILTGIILIIVGPMIYASSPGPLIFKQGRIGQNGKKFQMYKIRSMYPNAEERKKELLTYNRNEDGMMFKMDFDPRIIGNRIMPDGTHKTGIGQFIRSTSLDEFPQFFNVLKGDMSLVGTRPPTVDEWEKYKMHHRARMSIRPGITGLWQISGRNEITDFEEVVKLDTEYITNWKISTDLKIILQTIGLMIFGRNGM